MVDIINLRQARKSKQRLEKQAQAAENRTKFGQSLAEKKRFAAQADKDRKSLDGHLITRNSEEPT